MGQGKVGGQPRMLAELDDPDASARFQRSGVLRHVHFSQSSLGDYMSPRACGRGSVQVNNHSLRTFVTQASFHLRQVILVPCLCGAKASDQRSDQIRSDCEKDGPSRSRTLLSRVKESID